VPAAVTAGSHLHSVHVIPEVLSPYGPTLAVTVLPVGTVTAPRRCWFRVAAFPGYGDGDNTGAKSYGAGMETATRVTCQGNQDSPLT